MGQVANRGEQVNNSRPLPYLPSNQVQGDVYTDYGKD